MKTKLIAALFFFIAGLACRSSADNVVIDAAANDLILDTAPGATSSRDIWGDTWFPEWNTLGDPVGYRNDNPDPNLPTFSLSGNVLTATKVIDATGGEDRWDRGALLIFGYDGTQYVRFGMWSSPGRGALKGTTQTLTFTVPSWVKGQILYEYWTWYGAVNNIDNWFFDAQNQKWVKQDLKSHLARSFGNAGGIDVTTFVPAQLSLATTPSSPSGSITPSSSAITFGNSVTFALTESGADNSGITFTGDAVNLTTPPSSVVVTPDTAGTQSYRLNVPGSVILTWKADSGNSVTLKSPLGDLNVTSLTQYVVTANHGGPGVYSVIQTDPWGKSSIPLPLTISLPNPFSVTAVVNVTSPAVVSVTPQAASYTVPDGIAAGHTYQRSWSDGGGWNAYLGRDGVLIGVTATGSTAGISQIELQAKPPTGDWTDLLPIQTIDSSVRNGPNIPVSLSYSVKLGTTRADKPLIPTDATLAGTWQLRARASTNSAQWSGWSPAVPLSVQMPIASVTKTGQTLPPVEDAAWFTASDVKTYTFQVWVP